MQGLLELAGVAYVGAGVLGSAVGMDKDVTKRLLRDAGIPIVDFRGRHGRGVRRAIRAPPLAGAARARLPAVRQAGQRRLVGRREPGARAAELERGGARGARLRSQGAARARRRRARDRVRRARATTIPLASMPGEILVHHRDGFYSYDAKYVDADGASLEDPRRSAAGDDGRACRSSPSRRSAPSSSPGMARVDFFLERDSGALYVNEVNTIPGFTAISMYPKMWEASGLSPRALVSRLIDLAIERRDAAARPSSPRRPER